MLIPDKIAKTIAFEDQFFDLKGLSAYSSLGISSLRHHIRGNGLPVYCIRNHDRRVTKTLVERPSSHPLDAAALRADLDSIADEVLAELG